jgi:hypothetical protein
MFMGFWIKTSRTSVYFDTKVYLSISSFPAEDISNLTCIWSKGKSCALGACKDCVMMLNSPMTQGTLIQAKVNPQMKAGEIVVYSGSLNDNKYNSLKRYQIVHATDGSSSQRACFDAVILNDESNF